MNSIIQQGKKRLGRTHKRFTNVWTDIKEEQLEHGAAHHQRIRHLTPKPIKAIQRIIQVHTQENDTIFDCFVGSGTTAIASILLNRCYIVGDINKEYCEITKQRIIKNCQKINF